MALRATSARCVKTVLVVSGPGCAVSAKATMLSMRDARGGQLGVEIADRLDGRGSLRFAAAATAMSRAASAMPV